ncbi:hypothetical protein JTE90_007642, partial [Oedothorax gibbosus]
MPNINTKLCEVHFTDDQFENHRADNRRLLKQTAVPSIFSHRPSLKSRRPSKYVLQKDSAEIPTGHIENDDQVPAEISVIEAEELEILPVANRLQGNDRLPSIDNFTLERDSTSEIIESLQRKLNLLQKKFRRKEQEMSNLKKQLSVLFTSDQLNCMEKGYSKRMVWSDETIEKALRIYLSCNTKGYNYLRECGYPLPSQRTVQRRIQNFVLKPGISHEVLNLLKLKIASMYLKERYVSIMFDEMQIAEGLILDASTKCVIGTPTIPSANGSYEEVAKHALVFFIGGVSTRWKQVVGYHFTGQSFCPITLKKEIFKIIQDCESIGLIIDSLVSDMGPHNQAFWRECAVGVKKRRKAKDIDIQAYCSHPVSNSRKLYIIADAPHILKNLRNHITQGQIVYLPPEVVKEHNLPTNEVSLVHIKDMLTLENQSDLKLCPQLTSSCLDIGHYDKMKVGPAHVLLNHAVA